MELIWNCLQRIEKCIWFDYVRPFLTHPIFRKDWPFHAAENRLEISLKLSLAVSQESYNAVHVLMWLSLFIKWCNVWCIHGSWSMILYYEYNEVFEKEVWHLINGLVGKGRWRGQLTQQTVANTWGWKTNIGKSQGMRQNTANT